MKQENTEQKQTHSPAEAVRRAVQSGETGHYSLRPTELESLSDHEVCAGALSFNELTRLVHAAPNGCLNGPIVQGSETKWLAQEIQYNSEAIGLAESEVEGPVELVEMLLFLIENYPQPEHFSERLRTNHCFFNAALVAGLTDGLSAVNDVEIQKGVVLNGERDADGARPDHCIAAFRYKGERYYAEIYPFVGVGSHGRSDALRLLKTKPEPPYGFEQGQSFTTEDIRSGRLDALQPSRADEVGNAYESGRSFEESSLTLLAEENS